MKRRIPDLCTINELIPKVEKGLLYLKKKRKGLKCYIICDKPIKNCMCI
jgi:hypothetical protein